MASLAVPRAAPAANATNSRSHVTATTRVNSSGDRVRRASVSVSRPKSAAARLLVPPPRSSAAASRSEETAPAETAHAASSSLLLAHLISARNSPSAWSACCRISLFGSASMSSTPSRTSGSSGSASTSGAASSAEIHPTKNWRTYGSVAWIAARIEGASARAASKERRG